MTPYNSKMANTKSKKPQKPNEDIDAIKSDVASFASSLGLSSAIPSESGFNDSDFRKKGPLKPQNPPSKPQADLPYGKARPSSGRDNFDKKKKQQQQKGRPNASVLPEVDKSKGFQRKYANLPKLPLVKASDLSGQWYSDAVELEVKIFGEGGKRIEAKDLEDVKKLVLKKKEVAERLMEQYSQDYEASRARSGDMKMVAAAQRSGTAADKVAAFTCLVEDNPIANLRSLDALLAMVTSKVGKRHALTGFEALRDLFMLRLLPDRKLKSLFQRPINHLPETKDGYSLLLFWYWEEVLKLRYERFVLALEEASRDMLPVLKDKSLKTIYTLLRSKSEQERRLLSLLVNKLGDPERKAASGAGYYLQCLLSAHPNMKAVVIEEVDSFLFRPNLGMRAKYHAVNFLSQIFLSRKGDGSRIAKRLVEIYFALFKVLMTEAGQGNKLDKKGEADEKKDANKNSKGGALGEPDIEMDSRLLSALLTGVNRAFLYVGTDEADDLIEAQTPILFKLVHSKNFNVGVQALMLLYQISSKNQIASDRFYRAMYSKLLVPAVLNSSKPEMFLGILFKAMKNDLNLKRVSSFAKRLLQVALQQPPQYACGCLFILSEVLKAKPPLWSMMLQTETVDEEVEHFNDIIEDSSFPNSSINELENVGDQENSSKDDVENNTGSSVTEDDKKPNSQEEKYSEEEDDFVKGDVSNCMGKSERVSDHDIGQSQVHKTSSILPGGYDPRHREPSYCNADHTSWWELNLLASHVHPSVSTMARTLLCGASITYNGDPLKDLSLGAFLDKFMEKKPKPNRRAEGTWHGGSQIAPTKKIEMNSHLIGAELLSLEVEDVPPEDLVFHTFYVNKMNSTKKPKKKKKKLADDEAVDELFGVGGSDESDNDEIEGMLGSTGNDEIEDDYDYEDLDRVVNEDDEDLLGSGSDVEMRSLNESLDDGSNDGGIGVDDDDDDVYSKPGRKKNKHKLVGGSGESPFASLEDYDHLLKDDEADKSNTRENRRSEKRKKRNKSTK